MGGNRFEPSRCAVARTRLQLAYKEAKPATTRAVSQTLVERIDADVEGIIYARLTAPFSQLLADDLMERIDAEMKNPDASTVGVRNGLVW